jgi:aminoglycoside/choline kinase family phosphotransferase
MSTMTPQRLTDVTVEWMTEALGVALNAIDVQQIGEGHGFMGELARVTLHPSDSKTASATSSSAASAKVPSSVVVKLPTSDPGAHVVGDMMRVWEREHCFYRDIAPQLNIRVPEVFVNIADPPCLVLEDLAPASSKTPAVPGDQVAGATLDQAQRSIDVLSRHHAAWFEHPLLSTFTWMPAIDDPAILTLGPTFAMGWPMFLERFDGQLPTRCLRWCEQFVETIPEWIKGHYDDPSTITHGDFRLDNLFFFNDGSVAVIDWQLSMRAPGQSDLVYFCANNLRVETRRQYESALIERYVAGLHAAGVPTHAVTVESVRRGYLEGLLFYAMSFGAGLLAIDPANERGTALFDALVRRTFTAVNDHDVGTVMGFT